MALTIILADDHHMMRQDCGCCSRPRRIFASSLKQVMDARPPDSLNAFT